jgi:hypothetical protein
MILYPLTSWRVLRKEHLADALVLRGDEGRESYEKPRGGAKNL